MKRLPFEFPLKFYNTATRKKETFIPINGSHVKMYTCGPTVYNFAHIGNFRTYVFEDLLRRTIKFFGYQITHVMNLTDVDDKTIKGAIASRVSLNEFTQPYKNAFFSDLKALHIEPAEYYPAATDYIPQMIKMIETLLLKGVAYQGGDKSIYFAIEKFPKYGCLSHLHLDELQVGASERIATDEYEKDHAADFVLWKHYDSERDGMIYWESPFGLGRPGWHLECSAMAMHLLGDTLDIHAGGIDNMFPHHENEIAQSESCSGKIFSKFWMHAEHLVVDHKKMSKSLGNFFTLRDLLEKGYSGTQIRYLLLQTHYKTQLNFTFQGLEAAKSSLQRLNDFVYRLQSIEKSEEGREENESVKPLIDQAMNLFAQSLADDLNISAALAALFDFVREGNALCDVGKVNQKEAEQVLAFLKKIDTVLDVFSFENHDTDVSPDLLEALDKRQEARKEKNWKLADEMRDYIQQKGYVIEDSPQGARLKKK